MTLISWLYSAFLLLKPTTVRGKPSWLENNISFRHFFSTRRKLIAESFCRVLDYDRYMMHAIEYFENNRLLMALGWAATSSCMHSFFLRLPQWSHICCLFLYGCLCFVWHFCMFLWIESSYLVASTIFTPFQRHNAIVEPSSQILSAHCLHCHAHTHCVFRSAQLIMSMETAINSKSYCRMPECFSL
jgi:hypothetical protein